ncbi:MAG: cell surface protein SprA [Saprospiraceae bacterium]
MNQLYYLFLFVASTGVFPWSKPSVPVNHTKTITSRSKEQQQDTIEPKDRQGDFMNSPNNNLYDLQDPSNIDKEVEYDPATNSYIINERIGNEYFRTPTYMTFQEYLDWKSKKQDNDYWNQVIGSSRAGSNGAVRDPIEKIDVSRSLLDRLFGGTTIDVKPSGNVDLTFGYNFQNVKNPQLTERQRKVGNFDFDMDIRMSINGKVGEKLRLSTNYNTGASFDFDNQIKIEYDAAAFSEDEIVKKIEAGNVSLPLRGTLIQGSQSLFGIKTQLQFGKLFVTGIVSQQRSQQRNIQIQNGAQVQTFSVFADEYDENKHFFLSHYNRDKFEGNLGNLPQVNNLLKINKLEVWVTNDRNQPNNTRDIIAIADIGEGERITNSNPALAPNGAGARDINGKLLPTNEANPLFSKLKGFPASNSLDNVVSILEGPEFQLVQARDFEKLRARLLNSSEYYFDPNLGFISLNFNLRPDQVLAVSYEYTYNANGPFKVGETTSDAPQGSDTLNVVVTKLIKQTVQRVDIPSWDLMMKNFYPIGAYNVNQEDFKLDLFYQDPGGGEKRFLPTSNQASVPLLRLFNLDNLNQNNDRQPDGIFDFVPNFTIHPRNGRMMFPVLEPFGSALKAKLNDPAEEAKYVYQVLYDSTVTRAREYPELNRYLIRGQYKTTVSSEFSLGAYSVPEGSVRVTAGGQLLKEGLDFEVDYNLGRVRILNDALLNAGSPINVSFEDNSLFSFQTKTVLGLRADYAVNKNFNVGGTFLKLFERPFTQKVNVGDDPINNNIYGLDVNFTKDAPWLTRLVDAIPGISTKAASSLSVNAETAILKPGHSKAINQGPDKGGSVYIDDFEGSAATIDLRVPANAWVISSVPQNDKDNNNPLFPEASLINNQLTGVNRALLNWYRIETNIRNDKDELNPYTRTVNQQEIFPTLSIQPGLNTNTQTFDITYYPKLRGPYNFDVPGGTPYSEGLDGTGELIDPQSRWGGIMRPITTTDFEAANVEYVEFWMMNPFLKRGPDDPSVTKDGKIILNLGNISEDILRDSRLFFENGLPGPGQNNQVDTTQWSRIPRVQQIVNAFDNDQNNREAQDIGYDGFNSASEGQFFKPYLDKINASPILQTVKDQINADPANDDFKYYRDKEYDDADAGLFERYRKFNNPEGNSKVANQNDLNSATNIPDSEDLNRDNTLSETEAYFQYEIPIENDGTGQLKFNNFITDTVSIPSRPGEIWYRFKIPVDQFTNAVGGIQDFRTIRFVRMFFNGFDDEVTFRFARFDLVRNQWRRYRRADLSNEPQLPVLPSNNLSFDVNAVSIEQNSQRQPFKYVLPKGITREKFVGAFQDVFQNEQSLSLDFTGLGDGQALGIYKIINLDMRVFERMKMFVHAESPEKLPAGELAVFIRMGQDFKENYYEYEIPLTMSSTDSIDANNYADEVWKEENAFDFPLKLLSDLKINRNNVGTAITTLYTEIDPAHPLNKVRIIGNPTLGLVKTILIGVKNKTNDGLPHDAEIWVNELRLNGFDERGGVAALARVSLQLADFGNVAASANYSSVGFGALDQKVAQRSREEVIGYDVSTNFELGKFLPEKSGIKVPFYAQYSNVTKIPEYDPYDLDLNLKEKIKRTINQEAKDSIRDQAIDQTTIKGFNFTNVRKDRTKNGKKPMPWDIENLSATYRQNEKLRQDPIISRDLLKQQGGGLNYAYARPAKYITPLKSVIKNDKYLKFIKDFNFNPLPNSFTWTNDLDRMRQVRSYRFSTPNYGTSISKQFTWTRAYTLIWDLSQGLKFRYNANNLSVIDELDEMDRNTGAVIPWNSEQKQAGKEYIWDNIKRGGRNKAYTQTVNLTWTLPFRQFPFLDFVSGNASFNATYGWSAAALNADSLGNFLNNTQTRQLGGELNFERLYAKSKYLDRIQKGKGGTPSRPSNAPKGTNKLPDSIKSGEQVPAQDGKGGTPASDQRVANRSTPPAEKSIANDATKPTDDKSADLKSGNPASGSDPAISPGDKNSALPGNAKNAAGGIAGKSGPGSGPGAKSKTKEPGAPSTAEMIFVRPLLSLRKGRFNYTENYASFVPGYSPRTDHFGASPSWDAPGVQYILGFHPDRQFYQNGRDSWIKETVYLNQELFKNRTQSYDGRITLEPFKDVLIELEANKSYTDNRTEFFKDTLNDGIRDITRNFPRQLGSMTMSYNAIGTIFERNIDTVFSNFERNRTIISQMLGMGTHPVDGPEYTEGYGRVQQEVLVPAFLASYSGKNPSTFNRNIFGQLPKLNWNINYKGLSKLPFFKEIFSSVNISHAYKSTLTVNSYATNDQYKPNTDNINTNTQNYFSRFEIPTIVITEQFSPLIGVDIKTKNDLSLKVDIKKSRNLDMSFQVNQLNETKTTEITLGAGYKFKNVKIGFLQPKKKKPVKKKKIDPADPIGKPKVAQGNTLEFMFDFTLRDDITKAHLLDQTSDAQALKGAKTLRINPRLDYEINKNITVRLFYDYNSTYPAVSSSFPIINHNGGLTLRLTLN